jgi:UDP-glucose 4-epimerase
LIGIFGANGFIGGHLTHYLASQGHQVVAVGRSRTDFEPLPGDVRWIEADFRDVQVMKRALIGISTVVQLISSSSPALGNSNASGDIRENVLPHAEFLPMCVAAGVQRVIFMSSGGTVYGPKVGRTSIRETASTNPICSHGLTKLMVEKLIVMHGSVDQLGYVILRVSNSFGPRQVYKNGQGLIPALLGRHDRGQPVTVFGDGSATRDYIYIDDVVQAVGRAIDLSGHRQLTLNIGTGTGRSVMHVIRSIENVAGIKFRLQYVPARDSDVRHVRLDISKAREVLQWSPNTPFEDGLLRTLIVHGKAAQGAALH